MDIMDINGIKRQAEGLFDFMATARRHLHRHPELSGKEYGTQAYLLDFLKNEGVERWETADTGVVAIVRGREGGGCVALRSDMDALPIEEESGAPYASVNAGVMHACGHDAHTAINMGAVRFFNAHKDDFRGAVKFFFQPAEEGEGGAKRMIEAGCMANPVVDYCLGLHVEPYLPYTKVEVKNGALNASVDGLAITVTGKGGHGAYPDMCADAVAAAAQVITALQSVVSRNVSPLDSAVFTVGRITGGTANNIIADTVRMECTIRALSPAVRSAVLKRVKTVAADVSRAMGCGCAFAPVGSQYPALINDPGVTAVVEAAAVSCLGRENVTHAPFPSMGGEDFSFFCERTKSAFYHVGCKLAGKGDYGIHTKNFDIDERCLVTGLSVQCAAALELLSNV